LVGMGRAWLAPNSAASALGRIGYPSFAAAAAAGEARRG
jgi:hypothetical protein